MVDQVMDESVASKAKSDQVVRGMIGIVPINVMNVNCPFCVTDTAHRTASIMPIPSNDAACAVLIAQAALSVNFASNALIWGTALLALVRLYFLFKMPNSVFGAIGTRWRANWVVAHVANTQSFSFLSLYNHTFTKMLLACWAVCVARVNRIAASLALTAMVLEDLVHGVFVDTHLPSRFTATLSFCVDREQQFDINLCSFWHSIVPGN